MKIILVLAIILSPFMSFSQLVEDVNLDEKPEIQYIDISCHYKGDLSKCAVAVNYGQPSKGLLNFYYVKDANGKNYYFNNLPDALNKFYGWGWELVTLYNEENQFGGITHAVMKRKAKIP